MFSRLQLSLLFLIALLCPNWPAHGAQVVQSVTSSAERPYDLILAIDVSGSMIAPFCPPGRDEANLKNWVAPSDPEGIRWDGVHFILDIAQPKDRIALVLFSGSAVVLSEEVERGGFVELDKFYELGTGAKKSGRVILKELVTELQTKEREVADKNRTLTDPSHREIITDYEFKVLGGKKATLLSGTSVVFALDTIRARSRLLQQMGDGRQGWMLLFTDGYDENPFRHGAPTPDGVKNLYPPRAYTEYLDRLEKARSAPGGLEKWVDPYVRSFRDKEVQIVTFALGDHCDEELLRIIGRGMSYKTPTNLELLRQLQSVGWELREYWHVGLAASAHGQEQKFTLPRLDQWRDLGLLLYCQPRQSGGKRTFLHSPQNQNVRPLQLNNRDIDCEPLRSRSHWYYTLDAENVRRMGLPLDQESELIVLPPKEDEAKAILAFRTREPLFTLEEPVSGARFTPLDAIPLLVRFTPPLVDGRSVFDTGDFVVTASLSRTEGGNRIVQELKPLPSKPGARGSRPSFYAEAVLDPDPTTHGRPELIGRYNVDIVIEFARGVLKGAQRQLLRRIIDVAPYPDVRLLGGPVVLTNKSAEACRRRLTVELPVRADATHSVATATARLERKPIGPKKNAANVVLSPLSIDMRGGKGELHLEVDANEWAAMPVGRYEGGRVQVAVPWSDHKHAWAELVVEKSAYKLEAPELVTFDLSDRSKTAAKQMISVALATALSTDEEVWLSNEGNVTANQQPTELVFHSASNKATTVTVAVKGLGRERSKRVRGIKSGEPEKFELELAVLPQIAPGRYETRIFFVGNAVDPLPLRVRLMVDQLYVAVEEDGKLRDIDRLALLGMAGTQINRTLVLRSALPEKALPSLSKALRTRQPNRTYVRLGDRDRLPATLAISDGGRIRLSIEVPISVSEGAYQLPMEFALDTASGPVLVASLPVEMHVVHYAVRPDVPIERPLRIPLKKECSAEAALEVRLVTEAERNTPVRWEIKAVPLKSPGPGRPLKHELIDVRHKGQSILGSNAGPRPSLSRDNPVPITIAVNTSRLEPGLYHARLEFTGSADTPPVVGQPSTLDVEVLIPGRVAVAEWDTGARAEVGQPLPIRILVSCYSCEPGEGDLRFIGVAGPEGGVRIDQSKQRSVRKATGVPELSYHEYVAMVMPQQAGKAQIEVRWPRLCPVTPADAKPADMYVLPAMDLNALGRVEIIPSNLCYIGEDVIVRAALAPKAWKSEELPLRIRSRDNKGTEIIDLVLHDDGKPENGDEHAGDGIFAARFAFNEAGNYEIALPPGKTVQLLPGQAHVGFGFRQRVTSGEMLYGGGTLGQLLFAPVPNLNLERLSMPDVVEVENKQSGACRFRAALRYPARLHDARELARRDLDRIELRNFEAEQHLKASLVFAGSLAQADESDDPTELQGILQPGGKMQLGVQCELSEDAVKRLYDGDGTHPTLGQANGLVVELSFRWTENGKEFERVLRAPITVQTRSWKLHGAIVGAVLVIVLVGSYVAYRRWLAKYIWAFNARQKKEKDATSSWKGGRPGSSDKNADLPLASNGSHVDPGEAPPPREEGPLIPPDY